MAKQLLHALGYPSVVNLKTVIKTNTIWDNPITKSNIKLIEHLFRPNIPRVESKNYKMMPTPASQQHGVYSSQIT